MHQSANQNVRDQGAQVDSPESTFRELTAEEIGNQVSGGFLCLVAAGVAFGYYIDQTFIKPLWNN